MIQTTSFINSKLNHLFGSRGQTNLAKDDAVTTANNKFDGATNLVQLNAEIAKYFGRNTLALAYKTEQEVLRANIIVLEALRFLLSETQDFSGTLCKLIKPISVVHLFVT